MTIKNVLFHETSNKNKGARTFGQHVILPTNVKLFSMMGKELCRLLNGGREDRLGYD